MGYLDLFSKMLPSAGLSALGSAVDFGFQALGNAVLPLSKAQMQQNEFNSSEAQRARDFSAAQAEIDRDWQESMYAKYDSLQGKVAQSKEAGVNPLFGLGASANMSAPSHSVAAPAAASGSVSPVGQISDMVGSTLAFSKLQAEIKNMEASTRKMDADALIQEINAYSVHDLNKGKINELAGRVQNMEADTKVKVAQIGEIASKIALNDATIQEKSANIALLTSKVLTEAQTRDLMNAQIDEIASRIGLNQEQARWYSQQVRKIDYEISNLWIDFSLKDKTFFANLDKAVAEADIAEIKALLQKAGFDANEWIMKQQDDLFNAEYNKIIKETDKMSVQMFTDLATLLLGNKVRKFNYR